MKWYKVVRSKTDVFFKKKGMNLKKQYFKFYSKLLIIFVILYKTKISIYEKTNLFKFYRYELFSLL